jgi:hypothetical protein
MAVLVFLSLLAVTVKQDGAALRAGCAPDAGIVAQLPAGSPVTLRYSLAGESTPCYKVAIETGGQTIEGYVPDSALDGLEDFEKARRAAPMLDTAQAMATLRLANTLPSLKAEASTPGLVGDAVRLIEISQPAKALELLQPQIRVRRDPTLLALAGVAAWRSDDSRKALEYLRGSLDIQPNPEIEALYKRVERESKGDQSTDKLYGNQVLLRYDPSVIPVDAARQMLSALDQEYWRISGQLGCKSEERIVAIVQSRQAYRKTTDTAEWNGGQFDGKIRVPVYDGQGVDLAIRRALAHETAHACLSMLGHWPAWFHEGLAQKLSGDAITPAMRKKLAELASQGRLPRLDYLRQDWSRLDAEHAQVAYALSLAAMELFFENYAQYGIANLVRNPARLAEITADLDRRLGL